MIAFFSEVLANFPADRCRTLHARIQAETSGRSGIEYVAALVWPNYVAPVDNHPGNNRASFDAYRKASGRPLWAWLNASADQDADAQKITTLDAQLNPDGWKLDVEGEWVKTSKLTKLMGAAKATGKPVSVSFAGTSASHVSYDFRTVDLAGAEVDWQAYFRSQEGQPPALSVAELYRSSFVIPGWEYRSRWGKAYGWGKVERIEHSNAVYDSYKVPDPGNAVFAISPREWGWTVVNGKLYRDGKPVGQLLGRAKYSKIRITLDVTDRGPGGTVLPPLPASEWEQIAASARVPGFVKRPIMIYLAERCSDDVAVAIAKGAP